MSGLKLYLLGSPHVELDGEPVQVDTRKGTALLAYLAVTGASHTRDTPAVLFWPESRQARATLRQSLWVLKRALGEEWLEVGRESLGLKQDEGFWLDVAQFDHLLAACQVHDHPAGQACPDCADALSQAVELYQGDFLAGFSLRDSPGFDEWQFFLRVASARASPAFWQRLVHPHRSPNHAETRPAGRKAASGSVESAIRWSKRSKSAEKGPLERLF